MAIQPEKNEEKVSVADTVSFYKKYKNQIFLMIAAVVGILGGNTDRILSYVGDLCPATSAVVDDETLERIKSLETFDVAITKDFDDFQYRLSILEEAFNESQPQSKGRIPITE